MEKPAGEATLAAQDQALLQQLFAQQAPSPAIPIPVEKPEPKVQKDVNGLYSKSLESLAYIGSILIAAGLWFAGAYFTLQFLISLGIDTSGLGLAAWLIPMIITAIELTLWPRAGRGWQRAVVFLAVLAFDVGSSFAGMVTIASGRTINLFTGITLPRSGIGLWLIAGGLGLVFAFIPEKIGRWAVRELRTLWKRG